MTRRLAILLFCTVIFVALTVAAGLGGSDGAISSADPIFTVDGVDYDPQRLKSGDGDDNATVALVSVQGVIVDGHAPGSSGMVGGDDLSGLLKKIRTSDDFDGVILEVNTPGGAVLASDEVSEEVRKLSKDNIPVVAWMRSISASGGYYISANADHIVAHRSTLTGSIGVIMEYIDVQGLADKIGVKPVTYKSAEMKDIGSMFRDATPEEKKVLQSIIDEAYGQFVSVVAEGRDLSESTVRKLADGRIYTGTQGSENGLVDSLGGRNEAYKQATRLTKSDDINVVAYAQRFSWADLFSARGGNLDLSELAEAVSGNLLNPSGIGNSSRPAAPQLDATGSALGGTPGLPKVEYRAVL